VSTDSVSSSLKSEVVTDASAVPAEPFLTERVQPLPVRALLNELWIRPFSLRPVDGVNRPICARFYYIRAKRRFRYARCDFAVYICESQERSARDVPTRSRLVDSSSCRAAQPFEEGQNLTKGRISPTRRYSAPMSALQNRTCMVISIGRYGRNFAIPLLTPLVS
jgi:hypothetical protein